MNMIAPASASNHAIEVAIFDDAQALVDLHRIATDGVGDYTWSTMMEPGEDIVDVGLRRYRRTNATVSYENCAIIRDDAGHVAAMMLAYPMTVDPAESLNDFDPVLRPLVALEEDNSYYINILAVGEGHRRRGLASSLMREAENRARAAGLKKMSLICFEQNTGAFAFYASLGYRETKRAAIVPHPMIQVGGDAVLLIKDIDDNNERLSPMTKSDAWGAPVSTTEQGAVDGLNKAHGLFQGYFNDPVATIDETLAAHPDFAMGHLFKAGLYALSTEKAAFDELPGMLDNLRNLSGSMNERELGHFVALQAWSRGDLLDAVELWGDVVARCPRDVIALQFTHQGDFLFGQARMLRDRIDWALPHWSRDDHGYGYLLGMKSFGLEESGEYAAAEAAAREALDLNKHDTWATHGLAHVMEMQGRDAEGIRFLEDTTDDWSIDNGFSFHNWWHLALYYLESGNHAEAIRLYDKRIHPARTEVAMELLDGAALLWRLHVMGHDVGDRWSDVADVYEAWIEDGYYAFNDMHAMMSFTATGRDAAAARLLNTLQRRADDQDINGRNTRQIGLPVCRALNAFGRESYDDVVRLLKPVRNIANRFGGSHAQRDVLDLTMLEAAIRGGDTAHARVFAAERLARKPESPLARGFKARTDA